MKDSYILQCVSALALASAPASAWAETQKATETNPAQAPSADLLAEIVVTAQKRAEKLQSVPIAITAVTGDTLLAQGITATQGLAYIVPGLVIGHTASSASTYLRGVGQAVGTVGGESAIATYLDGIYLGAPAAGLFDLTNVDQVAVLRGPQGTLFGRNSTGGLIQVTTKDPSFDRLTGKARIGYGNLQTLTGSALLSGPITPTLATSLSFVGHRSDKGYIRNTYTNHVIGEEKSYAAQVKTLWEIGPDTKAMLNFFHVYYDGVDGIVASVYNGTLASDGITLGTKNRTIPGRFDPYQRTNSNIVSFKLEHSFDWAQISNQTSYVRYNNIYHFNQNGTSGRPNPNNAAIVVADNDSDIENYANELQLQSLPGGRLSWIIGTFYFKDKTGVDLNLLSDETLLQNIKGSIKSESIAGFAQATQTLFSDTHVTLGLRYTVDDRHYSALDSLGRTPATFGTPTKAQYKRFTWRISLDQKIGPDLLAYASYNRGFKSGNYSISSLSNPPFDPEVVDAYEIGFKSEPLNGRARLNVSGFYYNYDGIQLKAQLPPTFTALTYNAASSRIYGIDADFAVRPVEHFTISGGFEWLHAKYTSLPTGIRNIPNPVTAVPAGCVGSTSTTRGGARSFRCDLSGNDLIRAPRFSANLGVQYSQSFEWGKIDMSVADAYMSKYYFEPDNFITQDAHHWVTTSVTWHSPDDRFSVQVWGTNIINSNVYSSAQTANNFTTFIGKPRTYGVTLGVDF